jgi:transposase-like protein/transposase Tn5 family protein
VEEERMMDGTIREAWAALEFGDADLGDSRRTARLVQLATAVGAQPTASLPEASDDPAMLKAAYRFFDNDAINPNAMLASHVQATTARLRTVRLALAVQDTTLLDWTHHPATTGLGPLASVKQQGLLAHSTLVITPDRVPLGLLAQEVWARDAETYGQQVDHKQRALADKESHKWVTSLQAVNAAQEACPDTHLISVGDREADVYDLFLEPRRARVDLLVRAAWDRRVEHEEQYLWASVAAAPQVATLTLRLPKQGAQPARTARLRVHQRTITLRPPKARAKEQLAPVRVWAVWAIEAQPPAGVVPIEWLLLTTYAVVDGAGALAVVEWYACRWGIEVWHKILKSGCRIEARQLETAARLQRCLTLYSVIAWRILYATMLARAVPDAPCTVLLEDEEWQALWVTIHRRAPPPATPPSLRQAVRWIGQLGGFLGRKRDGEPGAEVLWKGFQHLVDLTTMYHLMRPPVPRTEVGND